jgi:hypothetical protein
MLTNDRRAEIAQVADERGYLHGSRDRECLAIRDLLAEADRLIAAIKKHHDQRADDRCWLDDCDLYLAAGLPDHDARVGDKALMLANCKRFIEQRCGQGGPWKSYIEVEAEAERLRQQLSECHEFMRDDGVNSDCPSTRDAAKALLRRHGQPT